MKKLFLLVTVTVTLLLGSACEKDADPKSKDKCDHLPHNAAPTALVGNWANGYSSFTQLVDVYNGRYLGNAWQSGKLFKITGDGRNAEFYYTVQSQYAQSATKATGTIHFDAGSNAQEGSFTFNACWAHFNGWGTTRVDRDATADELANQLSRKYFYKVEGHWLRIEPGGPVNTYTSSFRLVN